MRFSSDELLEEFGNDGFHTKGLWCTVAGHCMDCDLWFSCKIGTRNDYNETEKDTEIEPCGCDYTIRNIHHGFEMRKNDFKKPYANKSWHDNQPLCFPAKHNGSNKK